MRDFAESKPAIEGPLSVTTGPEPIGSVPDVLDQPFLCTFLSALRFDVSTPITAGAPSMEAGASAQNVGPCAAIGAGVGPSLALRRGRHGGRVPHPALVGPAVVVLPAAVTNSLTDKEPPDFGLGFVRIGTYDLG